MHAATPNTESTTKTYMHTAHLASPRELRTNVSVNTSETDSDAVFQGLQNRQRDLLSRSLAKIATTLGSVPTALFRLFLTFSEATVPLNPTNEELGQSPACVVFQGLQNCQRDLVSP
jgi:hypothetical protein